MKQKLKLKHNIKPIQEVPYNLEKDWSRVVCVCLIIN